MSNFGRFPPLFSSIFIPLSLSLSRNVPSRAPGLPGAQTLIHAPSGPNKDGPGRHLLLLFQGTEYNNHQRQQQPEINGVPTNDRGKSRMCSKTSKEIKSAGEWPTWRVAQKSFSPCHSLGWLVEDRVVLGKIKTCALYLIINTHTHTTGWWEGNNTKGGGEDSKSRFCGAINRPPIFSLLSRTLSSPQQVTMAINRREGLQHLKTLGQFERAKTCLERFLLFVGAKWKSFKAKKKKKSFPEIVVGRGWRRHLSLAPKRRRPVSRNRFACRDVRAKLNSRAIDG